jgi:hypothetical protein
MLSRYKSPPTPTGGNLETRLPIIPTPPPPQSSAASARQTYATSTPGIHRHTINNDAMHNQTSTSHPHGHHAAAMHSPASDGGPPFNQTEPFHRLFLPGTMAGSVALHIHPKVDRGFFVAPEDNEWTCYRRNYFQITVAYSITSPNPQLVNETLLGAGIMMDYHGRQERVTGFKITIGARVYGSDQKIIDLVQHTPKRDKGPQLKPALNLMMPGGDVERHAHHDATDTDEEKAALSGNIAEGDLPRIVTYERIQFKQATANNGKRRAAQQYFSLIVEAYAVILGQHGQPEDIRVAVVKSSPVVVRGRSPGHYSDTPPSEGSIPIKRPPELTSSTSFLRNEQPSPTSIKSTPTMPGLSNPATNTTPASLQQTTPVQNADHQDHNTQQNNNNSLGNDLDFLASLEADFDGYQYLPFTLLDPQGKIVVPHDLFYDPHEFPDTHYANLFSSDPSLSFPPSQQDPLSTTTFNNNQTSSMTNDDGGFSNLYQGFFDFPAQTDTSWNAMGRGGSQQSTGQGGPFPKDRIPTSAAGATTNTQQSSSMESSNWFDTFQANAAQPSQAILSNFRPTNNQPPSQPQQQSQQQFAFPFPAQQTQNDTGTPGGNGNGKWMFEFRNSSYGYFPNLPAVGDMHTS